MSLSYNRFLLQQMVMRNIQLRFRGSFFGWIWSLLLPLLMLTVYTVIFGSFFKSRWGVDIGENKMVYAVALFSGITFYNIFSESVSISAGSIIGNVNYVKKVRFPLEFLPLSQVLSSALLSIPWFLLLFGCVIFVFKQAALTWLLLPFSIFPLLLFSAGVSFFVASLGVFFRDIQYLIGVLLQMLFFLSPIFYRLDNVPAEFKPIMALNPMLWFIELNRNLLFYGSLPDYSSLPAMKMWLVTYIIGIAVFLLGGFWFVKTKKGFSDVL